jgi:hypothetical protein
MSIKRKPPRSVNMGTSGARKKQMNRTLYQEADNSLDVVRLGRYTSDCAVIEMRPRKNSSESRLEERHSSHLQFVGRRRASGASQKHYSVDLDDFQV